MYRKLLLLFIIYFLTLFSLTFGDYKSDANNEQRLPSNETFVKDLNTKLESDVKTLNASDDYEYEGLNDNDEEDNGDDSNDDSNDDGFIDKLKRIHEENRNIPISKNVKTINETFELLMNTRKTFGSLFGINERERLKLFEFITDVDIGLSADCLSSFMQIYSGLSNTDLWAIKFIDSMGSFPPKGFAEGVFTDLGEYEECLDIESPLTDKNPSAIKGQHCVMKIIIPFPTLDSYNDTEYDNQNFDLVSKFGDNFQKITIKNVVQTLNVADGTIFNLGICIPSKCRPKEVENMINKIMFPLTRMPVEIESNCQMKDQITQLDNFQLISITILSALTLLVMTSTGLELYARHRRLSLDISGSKPTKINELLDSFSLIKNVKSLFTKSNQKFASLDTIRLILIINVHIAHVYIFTYTLGLKTQKKLLSRVFPKMFADSKYFFVRNPLMLDSLFTLSGFIVSYGLLRKLSTSNGRFNYFGFLFQNWFRFGFLAFGSLIFFYLFPLSGDGPFWDIAVDYVTTGCKDPLNLWKIITFSNNFNEFDGNSLHRPCNTPLWFLSSLLQFLTITPIFIITYYKRPKTGFIAIIIAIIIALFITISPYLLYGIKPYLQIVTHGPKLISSGFSHSFKWYHMSPNVHFLCYLVGIAFGFLMIKKVSFSRLQENIFWMISAITIIGLYVWNNSFWKLGQTEPVISALLYHTIGKLLFCVCFGWIYFACCSGRGGYLNQFLSWRGFQPISRLSFGIYLLHYTVVLRRVFIIRQSYVATDAMMFKNIFFDLMIEIILAFIFYVLIESPFINIFKLIFSPKIVDNKQQISKLEEIHVK